MQATSTAVDVVGNNLANLSTTGYKASSVSFHDLVSQSLTTNLGGTQSGLGTARAQTVRQFNQGSVQSTSGPLDAAIQGDGFFVLKDSRNNQLLTRAGNFTVDAAGTLITSTKEHVQGWNEVNGKVDTNGAIGDITVPTGNLRQPFATTTFSTDLNLNSASTVGAENGTFSTPVQIVDSLGSTHVVTLTFTKTGPGAWSYEATIPGGDLTAGTAGTPSSLVKGTLTFDAQGHLKTPAATDAGGLIAVPITGLADGAADLAMNWSLYTPAGTARLTQIAEPSAVSASLQDGTDGAQLVSVNISDGGAILAKYSNGQEKAVGQLALASVRNPDSLLASGNNNFAAGASTAPPVIGSADTGGRGHIVGGALEGSTVDIAREFTNLIMFQRGYEANAKVITAEDELSQTTINLKR
ncbi:MAG: flagellar hook protein FlgE [Acidobacteriota bacterium]|nr:flagellar hook protein FlgE [Acidobacteriota bacterium]